MRPRAVCFAIGRWQQHYFLHLTSCIRDYAMNAATILLVLAAAGQTGWTPDRYATQPSTAAPTAPAATYDRYTIPQSGPRASVAPPPGVVDRTRNAFTETATTLSEGLEAGIGAANEQLSRTGGEIQGWADDAGRQLRTAGDHLRGTVGQTLGVPPSGSASNPFGSSSSSSSPPSTTTKTRGNVAPPPWSGPAATTEPDWTTDFTQPGTTASRSGTAGVATAPAARGWTSIGTNVAAPPLLVPQLTTTPTSETRVRTASNERGPNIPPDGSSREPLYSPLVEPAREPATAADSWSTGWGTAAQPATIGRDNIISTNAGTREVAGSGQRQPANARPPAGTQQTPRQAASQPPQQSNRNWDDLWDDTSWPDSTQVAAAKADNQVAGQTGAGQVSNSAGARPATPGGVSSSIGAAPGVVMPAAGTQPDRGRGGKSSDPEEPWMPLVIVSLSLAGSLGANLFLGFSYLDARQKYTSLARKTANKFRRAAA
jgi:hypothetical protein